MKLFGTVLVSAFALAFLGGCEMEDDTDTLETEVIEDADITAPTDSTDTDVDLDAGVNSQPLQTEPLDTDTGTDPAGKQLDLGDLNVSAPEGQTPPSATGQPAP